MLVIYTIKSKYNVCICKNKCAIFSEVEGLFILGTGKHKYSEKRTSTGFQPLLAVVCR